MSTPLNCPAGYTCDLDIYPAWHDALAAAVLVLLMLLLAFMVWMADR